MLFWNQMNHTEHFIETTKTQFEYYKSLGEKAMEQLSEGGINKRLSLEGNSISMIVNHLQSNMRSRWTDFLTTDGEKPWRNRDAEFDYVEWSKEELNGQWQLGWKCLFDAIAQINASNFDQLIYIRSKGHTITEALLRQLSHYAYHVGQIVFIAKQLRQEKWSSLSIPKGQSEAYNRASQAKGRRREHFTEDWIEDKKAT